MVTLPVRHCRVAPRGLSCSAISVPSASAITTARTTWPDSTVRAVRPAACRGRSARSCSATSARTTVSGVEESVMASLHHSPAAATMGDYGLKTTLTVPSVFFWNCS